jgi:hypothetical protein
MAQVAAVSMRGNVKDFGSFPGSGTPHYQLAIYREGAEFADTRQTTCDMDAVVASLATWLTMALPPTPARLPLRDTDRRALEAVAKARRTTGRLEVRVPPQTVSVADSARLHRDLASASARAIFASFPRDEEGRLALGETVLLSRHVTAKRAPKGRETWLVAIGPMRRADGDVIVLDLATPITANEPHVWDEAPWLWDERAQGADEIARWGVANGDVKAARCLELLDDGRFVEALGVYEVVLVDKVQRMLAGQPVSVHDAPFAESWREVLRRALLRAAPWRFAAAIAAARSPPPEAKRKQKVVDLWLRLFAFPGQRHQRKASLMLVGTAKGEVQIAIDWTGSNARLPETRWTRAIEQDLRRFGLEAGAA